MQAAADRADRNAENAGNLVVVPIVEFTQHENDSMLCTQRLQGLLHLCDALLAKQPLVRLLRAAARLGGVFQ